MSILVAGIDEAGYGPVLGPLVVASSIFLIDENPEANMWSRLRESVGPFKKGLGNRILITDSKKAYNRKSGLKHLERTIGAFFNQLYLEKTTFSSILPPVSNDFVAQIKRYPWYVSLYNDCLPYIDQTISSTLTENMKQEGIEFVDFRCLCIDVEEFNRLVDSTKNKATVVITSVLKLIRQIMDIALFFNVKKIVIFCDRLGSRTYYGDMLKTLPGLEITDVEESNKISKYKLVDSKRELQIQFEVGADDKHLPVALASMVGKYVRERIMKSMNEYFMNLQSGLKSTAGYWTDGHRFLKDLKDETLDKAGIERKDLVRIK